MKTLVSLLLLMTLALQPALAQENNQQEEVLKVVHSLFDAMASADSAAADKLFIDGGHGFRVQTTDDQSTDVSLSNHSDFINSIGGWQQKIVERIWDPKIMIDDNIAMAWTPYDLHVNGEFSHCGINLFSLIRTQNGWKIADITYNVRRESCKESPLGPLKTQ